MRTSKSAISYKAGNDFGFKLTDRETLCVPQITSLYQQRTSPYLLLLLSSRVTRQLQLTSQI